MSGEMQATIELSLQFHNFYNVDLFQRGFYQIRSYIKSSPKLPIKVEVSLPRNQASEQIFPACIINRTAVSRTVQILYRNEEVTLDDVIHFRIHALVDSGKIEEILEKADLQLILELWYTESGCDLVQENIQTCSRLDDESSDSGSKSRRGSITGSVTSISATSQPTIECVSSRNLRLNFNPTRGLHYHLPVLFDYFHLAAVSTTIHMVLTSVHQPYIKFYKSGGVNSGTSTLPKSRKSSSTKNGQSNRQSQPTMETIFFGPPQNRSSSKGCLEAGVRLSSARRIHHQVCSLLLASLESLQRTLMEFSNLLSDNKANTEAQMSVTDCRKRLNNLSEMAKDCQQNLGNGKAAPSSGKDRNSKSAPKSNKEITEGWERSRLYMAIDTEDEFLGVANSDISQLCGELVLLWNNFLIVCIGRRAIKTHLSRIHHLHRVKRFSEAFFMIQHSRGHALTCCEQTYARYAAVSEQLRASKYLSSLPSLPVSCTMLDGDSTTLPIIFEDKYQDDTADGVPEKRRESDLTRSPFDDDQSLSKDWDRLGPDARRHSFCDISKFEDNSNQDDEGLLTLKEILLTSRVTTSNGQQKKPPRPSSIPAAKKFGQDSMLNTEFDLVRIQKRLAKSVCQVPLLTQNSELIDNFANHQELQIVPNHFDHEDEPSVLAATPCLPSKVTENDDTVTKEEPKPSAQVPPHLIKGLSNGFSHLEWSATVPYNLAEEPDDVQGMKHSHSCHSMPGTSSDRNRKREGSLPDAVTESVPNLSLKHRVCDKGLESGCGTLDNIEETVTQSSDVIEAKCEQKQTFEVTSRPAREPSPSILSHSDDNTSTSCDDESETPHDTHMVKSKQAWTGSRDSGKHSFSSSPSDPTTCFINSDSDNKTIVSIKPKHDVDVSDDKIPTEPLISATVQKQTQEELSKKLEEFRLKSRSTKASFLDRPRAKSEEAMIKFSGDAIFQPRCRLQSDSGSPRRHTPIREGRSAEKKVSENLCAPLLVQSLIAATTTPTATVTPPVKVSLPPPVQFRDPPRTSDLVQTGGNFSLENSDSNRLRRENLERKISNSCRGILGEVSEPAIYESPVSRSATFENGVKDQARNRSRHDPADEDSGTIPLRKKPKPKPGLDECTASLSRLESKRGQAPSPAVYVSPSTQPTNFSQSKSEMSKNDSSDKTEDEPVRSLVPVISEETVNFIKAKEDFKKTLNFPGILYSDLSRFPSTAPYFQHSEEFRGPVRRNFHLVVCVHGLEGNSADLRLIKTYLEMALPGHNLDFLMSEGNQGDTFSSFESMTDRLVGEILLHISSYTYVPARISFVGHSLGCILIRSAISRPEMSHLVSRFYTYLSLSGPHLGTLYNNSGLVNMGMWFMQKWKKSGSLHQLALKDTTDIRKTFMYQLSLRSNLHMFKHVLLAGSTQDRYVPWHSARIELCKAAVKDCSVTGSAYREMVHNIISPIITRPGVTLCRYDIHHALPSNTTNTLIGRAAHIAVLDSELFIEKFLIISVIKYFK